MADSKDTKEEIIKVAEKLIRTRGYNGFSYKDISQPLRMKNAAIHYHFPTKEALGVAVIEDNGKRFRSAVADWSSYNYRDQLYQFIGIYEESNRRGLMCFMGALISSYDTLPVNMQLSLRRVGDEIRNWLKEMLYQGSLKREFRFEETIDEKADQIIAALMASLMIAKMTENDTLSNVKNSIIKSL